jgi:hypothetical protein
LKHQQAKLVDESDVVTEFYFDGRNYKEINETKEAENK